MKSTVFITSATVIIVLTLRNPTTKASSAISACQSSDKRLTVHQYFTTTLLQVWLAEARKSSEHSQALISPLGDKHGYTVSTQCKLSRQISSLKPQTDTESYN